MKKQPKKNQKSTVVTETKKEKPEFNPLLSEVVPDDSFSFTLLACHCSATVDQ